MKVYYDGMFNQKAKIGCFCIVAIDKEKVQILKQSVNTNNTFLIELKAVETAKNKFPGVKIFNDNPKVVELTGVHFFEKGFNPAHQALKIFDNGTYIFNCNETSYLSQKKRDFLLKSLKKVRRVKKSACDILA